MIQGAINQLIGIAAAAKKTEDIAVARQEREARSAARAEQSAIAKREREAAAASRAQQAKDRAMQRARDRIQQKWDQNKEYQEFVRSLGDNQAPEELKRIAFEASRRAPTVRIGGSEVDITRLSPEAQAVLRGGGK